MPNYFRDQANAISFKPIAGPNTGFRPGQLGALHAVVSHFSVYDEPAIVSLPTGYGKTAVIMALPFILGADRVLVVEPSDVLRRQTAAHFGSLSTLRKLNVLADDVGQPAVQGQKGRPASDEEWRGLEAFDVVVSTPASVSPTEASRSAGNLFDLVIFDEAHHAPADTWKAFIEHYKGARFVFLSATPFRRDKKAILGRIAYSYPVSKASREKAFGKVSFRAAQVADDINEEEVDRAIAKAAVAQLRADRANGFDHRLFARAASIDAANRLVGLYQAQGAQVASVNSHISKRRQDQIEEALLGGQLDGIVCVDMFGEGYDFPKLKIAALHAPHRSLVPTLQFIGRFARTNDVNTGDATLIAPVSRLKDATSKLFAEGVDIAQLIDAAAQEQIADAAIDREILDILKTRQQAESDYDAVSPLSLKLYAHARIFECGQRPDLTRFGSIVGRHLKLAKQWISEDGLITLLLTVDHEPPNWATSDVLVNVRHDAFLLAYNEHTRLCYIGSTRRTDRLYLELMETVCAGQHRPISYEMTRRAAAGLGDLKFYNVGLKNTALNTQAESYRVLTGPRAERAVTAGDGRAYVQGHFFGSGTEGDERETIGASSSSRIWSNQRLTIAEYLDWTSKLNARLHGDATVARSQLDLVQTSRLLREVPELIIGAAWEKTAYRYAPTVRFKRAHEARFRFLPITDFEITSFARVNGDLRFNLETDEEALPFVFSLAGGQLIRPNDATWECDVQSSLDDWTEMALWLSAHPPAFFAADKSSFQGVNAMPAAATTISQLAEGDAETLDWTGCAIDMEFGERDDGLLSVHQHLENHLRDAPGLEVLIYDHRSGEAADYIALIRDGEDRFRVALYHCKGAGGEPSGGRVNDVYEVACQLLKSVSYCDADILVKHVERRMAPRYVSPTRVVEGEFARFADVLGSTPADRLDFAIYGVQPGISREAIDEHLADLMAFGLDYVQRGGAAKAGWLVNA